jgi:CheY-like chemotaxis protein
MPKTVDTFHELAGKLDTAPTAPPVIEHLRRELHRIHGGAGSFGFPATGRLAGQWERQAVAWEQDDTLDTSKRGQLIREFAGKLASVFDQEQTVPAASAPIRTVATPPPSATAHAGDVPTGAAEARRVSSVSAVPANRQQASHHTTPDVVVIEDDGALADVFKYALEAMSLRVATYGNGARALETLLTMEPVETPVIVLLDIDLPGLDGHSIHEQLRIKRPGEFAVVFISARGEESDQLRALNTGAIDYLVKPVNLQVLLAKIPNWRALLSRRG